MKTTQARMEFSRLPKDYAGLCRILTPRPIHDKVEFQNVTEITDAMAGHDLEAREELLGVRPAMRLDESHREVRPALDAAMALLEHPVGLAHAGRHAEVDPESPAPASLLGADAREHLVAARPDIERVALRTRHLMTPSRSRLSWRTFTCGSPMKPSSGCWV